MLPRTFSDHLWLVMNACRGNVAGCRTWPHRNRWGLFHLWLLLSAPAWAQGLELRIEGKEVARTEDVVFHQIDEHTWVGTGRAMANESLYLVEGSRRAALIDAGTKINDLDKVVASITSKPVLLLVTHAHPDHTGSAINDFPEMWIHPAEAQSQFVSHYKGTIRYLEDGQEIDLGDRTLLVVFTPGHTPGSTTFVDPSAGYGFSGDSFGSGNLLLFGDFSTLIASCEKMLRLMERHGIRFLYPGHFNGKNLETKERIQDILALSRDVLSGKVKGEMNPTARFGLSWVVSRKGVKIHYHDGAVR